MSSYDPVRPCQQVRWNGQADLLGGFEIDYKLEFRWLLDRQVGGLSALKNAVNVVGGTPAQEARQRAVGHEEAGLGMGPADTQRG